MLNVGVEINVRNAIVWSVISICQVALQLQ